MTVRKSPLVILLIAAAMLTIAGAAFALSVNSAIGGEIGNAVGSGLAATNELGEARIAAATSLPDGFEEIEVVDDLKSPTNMKFSPDGRLFLSEQSGTIHIIKDDELLPTPFLTLEVESSAEGDWLD